ncbi:MAG TPA: NAD(P)/FAD-dependent oxidoreductase [Bacteroidales bacterium]|nr:NAD(P)/FAD-dependent oxidoreductase [Bacteroidales bacterium]
MDAGITIIGAGVIGLAIAEELSAKHGNVFVVERNATFGQETSSRNSEVIHAGIYYPAGSLKSLLCVEGSRLLYDYCRKYDVPFKNTGKIIVATSPEEIIQIEAIQKTAALNGVHLELIDRDKISSLEPDVFALKALYSPKTGIVDSHSLMKRFETNTINNGGQIVYKSEVTGITRINGGYAISIKNSDGSTFSFTTEKIINSAGLQADRVASMAGMDTRELSIIFSKGEYFRINPPVNKRVKMLIYPVPHLKMEGIGVHVTVDMSGGVRLGPDVKYLDSNIYDYTMSPEKQEQFFKAAVKFLPFLKQEDLSPDMAGIRPKIQKPGEPQKDFYIREESENGLPGFVNLIGMESPGLTSCISISKYVGRLIKIEK